MTYQVSREGLYAHSWAKASTKLNYFADISGEDCSSLDEPMPPRETLRSYLNRIFEETPELSEVKLSNRAKKLGHKISPGYVSNVRTGHQQNLSIAKLKALAAGLGRPAEEVISVASGKALSEAKDYQDSICAVIWNELKHLKEDDQRQVLAMLEVIHRDIQRRLS